MAEITLLAEPGRATGTPESKRLRASGRIPAVVYGQGGEATAVSVDARELRVALSGDAGTNQLIDLQVGGTHHLALTRMIQRHPVRNTVLHVDFQTVSRDEVISSEVPIVLIGEAKTVAANQGVVENIVTSLHVQSTPGNIPNEIEIDITHLAPGDTIRVSDIALPAGVTTDLDPEEAVVVATGVTSEAETGEGGSDGGQPAEGGEAGAEG